VTKNTNVGDSIMSNILLNADSYKASHFLQYPQNTSTVSSYIESRGGLFETTLFFGLQAFIKQTLLKPFNQADIDEAAEVLGAHGVPFNKAGWQYILDTYNGYFPLEIQAVPEGSVVADTQCFSASTKHRCQLCMVNQLYRNSVITRRMVSNNRCDGFLPMQTSDCPLFGSDSRQHGRLTF
jgi:nicotinic acid phosphoribosyltransferase